jgi:hypothetical protein
MSDNKIFLSLKVVVSTYNQNNKKTIHFMDIKPYSKSVGYLILHCLTSKYTGCSI